MYHLKEKTKYYVSLIIPWTVNHIRVVVWTDKERKNRENKLGVGFSLCPFYASRSLCKALRR